MDKHHRKYDTDTGLENFVLRLRENNSDLEYYSGYIDSEHKVNLRCKKCGTIFSRYASCVRQNKKIRCYECEKIETRNKRLLEEQFKEQRRYLYQESKRYESKKQFGFSICVNCGKLFIGDTKYCSSRCLNRKYEGKKEKQRLQRAKQNGEIDKTITLDKLIERDNNICKICNKMCDKQDYEIKDGVFYVGSNYPSIDHIIPLSKGGTHTWNNVQLAHMYCNSIKSNKLF